MIEKAFDAIDYLDVQALVDRRVPESRTLEYKQQLPGRTNEEKREFLADVSSFANASGGDILFGMEEERDASEKATGVPAGIVGLGQINVDEVIRRLDNLIRDGIEPRPRAGIRALSNGQGLTVLIVRVPSSWSLPHAVTLGQKSFRFYSRNSAGKYPLDVHELRSLFAVSEGAAERVRHFRAERLARIVADETPVPLGERPKIVLHLYPMKAALGGLERDVTDAVFAMRPQLDPITEHATARRYNLDGYLSFWQPASRGEYVSYLQVFRSGIFEAVDSFYLEELDVERVIDCSKVEVKIIAAFSSYIDAAQKLGIDPPIVAMLSLLGVHGASITSRVARHWEDAGYAIDRDELLLPEIVIDDFCPESPDLLLRPAFDALWQAAGWDRCKDYNESGRHIGHDG